jgi:hypothetical protein
MGNIDRTAWNQFLDQVDEACAALKRPNMLWYRGHANKEWALVPSLLRRDTGPAQEQFLFREYSRFAKRFPDQPRNDWGFLMDMQHYGLPTRLLDWTEVLGVAVAFAVLRQCKSPTDAAFFILDPVALNSHSGLTGVKHLPDNDFEYQSVYWHNRPFAAVNPIAIELPFQNPRILAQRGVFTVHGSNPACLAAQCQDAARMVVLPVTAQDAAREFLKHANLNESSIYPDIFGIVQHIESQAFGEIRFR